MRAVPHHARARAGLAMVYVKTGRTDEAEQAIDGDDSRSRQRPKRTRSQRDLEGARKAPTGRSAARAEARKTSASGSGDGRDLTRGRQPPRRPICAQKLKPRRLEACGRRGGAAERDGIRVDRRHVQIRHRITRRRPERRALDVAGRIAQAVLGTGGILADRRVPGDQLLVVEQVVHVELHPRDAASETPGRCS